MTTAGAVVPTNGAMTLTADNNNDAKEVRQRRRPRSCDVREDLVMCDASRRQCVHGLRARGVALGSHSVLRGGLFHLRGLSQAEGLGRRSGVEEVDAEVPEAGRR